MENTLIAGMYVLSLFHTITRIPLVFPWHVSTSVPNNPACSAPHEQVIIYRLHDIHFRGITIQVAAQLVPYKESCHIMLFFIFCLSARPAHDLSAVAKHKAIIFFYWTHSG